jgi:hypothetical protein
LSRPPQKLQEEHRNGVVAFWVSVPLSLARFFFVLLDVYRVSSRTYLPTFCGSSTGYQHGACIHTGGLRANLIVSILRCCGMGVEHLPALHIFSCYLSLHIWRTKTLILGYASTGEFFKGGKCNTSEFCACVITSHLGEQ